MKTLTTLLALSLAAATTAHASKLSFLGGEAEFFVGGETTLVAIEPWEGTGGHWQTIEADHTNQIQFSVNSYEENANIMHLSASWAIRGPSYVAGHVDFEVLEAGVFTWERYRDPALVSAYLSLDDEPLELLSVPTGAVSGLWRFQETLELGVYRMGWDSRLGYPSQSSGAITFGIPEPATWIVAFIAVGMAFTARRGCLAKP